jgi:hypothetical protein
MEIRTHAGNLDFRWSSPAGPFPRITPEQARQWNEDGSLEDAFDRATLDRVIDEIDPWESRVEAALREQGGRSFIARADEITFTVHLVLRSPFLRELVTGPVFQDLAWDLLGPDVRLYWEQRRSIGTAAAAPSQSGCRSAAMSRWSWHTS